MGTKKRILFSEASVSFPEYLQALTESEEHGSLLSASLGIVNTVHPNMLLRWLYLNLSRKKDRVVISLVLHLFFPLV